MCGVDLTEIPCRSKSKEFRINIDGGRTSIKNLYMRMYNSRVYVAISYPLRLHFPSIVVRDSIFLVSLVGIFPRA